LPLLEDGLGQTKTENGEQTQCSPSPNPGEWPVFGQQRERTLQLTAAAGEEIV